MTQHVWRVVVRLWYTSWIVATILRPYQVRGVGSETSSIWTGFVFGLRANGVSQRTCSEDNVHM